MKIREVPTAPGPPTHPKYVLLCIDLGPEVNITDLEPQGCWEQPYLDEGGLGLRVYSFSLRGLVVKL